MSQTVYGNKMIEYRSQLNEFVVEYQERQTEFDQISTKQTYSSLGDVKLKAENLLRMVRDHPMYTTLKDLVFDMYCKSPRTLDPSIAEAPNLRMLYESGMKSDPSPKL